MSAAVAAIVGVRPGAAGESRAQGASWLPKWLGKGRRVDGKPGWGNTVEADARLVERCLAGDGSAWEELVRTHTRRVYGICYRFTGSDAEAQDITQDVFVRVFQTLKSFRAGEGSFSVWVTRMTRNLLIDNYRRSKLRRMTDSLEDQLPTIEEKPTHSTRTEGMLEGREASEILQGALQRMSPELREAVVLRDLEEMEYKEIADTLKVPEGTVKSRINRGRAELGRILRKLKVVL
ncbi:MAG: sigma-70 family RNA polymerase sigma factor [Bryobacteraceae bacterium]